jgi:ArsR family transcriptional regulator
MVLHYAEDPVAALAEAARVLAPAGRLVVVDLAHHDRTDITERLAHRWPGFTDAAMNAAFSEVGLSPAEPLSVPGALEVRLWSATMPAHATADAPELVAEDA